MKKTDPTVIKETKYIALWCIIFSVLMQAVYLVASLWSVKVLLGNLLGLVISVGNFFLLGLTVQKAVTKDEKEAKTVMKLSQTYRNLGIVVLVGLGIILDCFDTVAVILPVFFPRIAIVFRPLFDKKADK
ncbi:MAG: hypothetical protein IJN63_02260 [Clostridia bacterium]|nr:hypothetical protein [Clostridia bacterium]